MLVGRRAVLGKVFAKAAPVTPRAIPGACSPGKLVDCDGVNKAAVVSDSQTQLLSFGDPHVLLDAWTWLCGVELLFNMFYF